MMASWLDLLQMELGTITEEEFIEPQTAVNPVLQVVGEMTIEMKGLYSLSERYAKQVFDLESEIRFGRIKRIKEEARIKMMEISQKHQTIHLILGTAVCEHFNLWDKPVVLCEGFKVTVVTKGETGPGLPRGFGPSEEVDPG